jgi:hypothetical protein
VHRNTWNRSKTSHAGWRRPQSEAIKAFAWVLAGTGTVAAWYLEITLPVRLGIVSLFTLAVWAFFSLRIGVISFLPRLVIVGYTLPFTALLAFLWNQDLVWWDTPIAESLIREPAITRQMLMVGIVGLLGLVAGMRMGANTQKKTRRAADEKTLTASHRYPELSVGAFVCWAVIAFMLSYVAAPATDIFTAAYSDKGSDIAEVLNFAGGTLASYSIILALWLDSRRIEPHRRRFARTTVLLILLLTILVYLQLLRGDRESFTLLIALAAYYLNRGGIARIRLEGGRILRRRIAVVTLPIAAAFAVFLALGPIRTTLSSNEEAIQGQASLTRGYKASTWRAVLLSNLSIASEFHPGPMEYIHGETYIDYVLSLPPGPAIKALGFSRPIDKREGPAWWAVNRGISAGGVHLIVTPFKNFGMIGVYLLMIFAGYLVADIESRSENLDFPSQLLYLIVVCSALLWCWYGDLYMIRGILIAIGLRWVFGLRKRKRSAVSEHFRLEVVRSPVI